MRAAALILAAALAGGCGPRPPGGGAGGGDAVVRIDCRVPDAVLWVDDAYVGDVGDLRAGVALRPGAHRLEIRHDRYHSRYIELTVKRGERSTVRVTLAPVLP